MERKWKLLFRDLGLGVRGFPPYMVWGWGFWIGQGSRVCRVIRNQRVVV